MSSRRAGIAILTIFTTVSSLLAATIKDSQATVTPGKAKSSSQAESAQRPVEKQSPTEALGGTSRYITSISCDKPIYKAGETLYIRGVLLDGAEHKPMAEDKSTDVTVQIRGPKGEIVSSGHTYVTDSVWTHSWAVPPGQAGGEYSILATYPNEGYTPAKRKFDVRAYRAPRLNSQIQFQRDGYGPGEKVTATLEVKRAEGDIPAGAKVTVNARVDGVEIKADDGTVDATGHCTVNFELPQDIARGEGTLALIVQDGGVIETASKTIPILLQTVDLQMYPEGGDLVAGCKNRVYVQAFQPNGQPADLVAHITTKNTDADGETIIAQFRTEHEGRGRFEFTPEAKKQYFLHIVKPEKIKTVYTLPEVKADGAVIRANQNIYKKGAPISVEVASTKTKYTVTVSKREKELFSRNVLVSNKDSKNGSFTEVTMPINADVDGVLTVTVWDSHGKPLAERLIFREQAKPLHISIKADKQSYAPGENAKVTVKATDEKGNPVSAVVGVTVTDESVLQMVEKREQAPQLPVMVFLEPEVKDLADAHVYLDAADPSKAALATDLLLGTQGWRRFAFVDAGKFMLANGDDAKRVLAYRSPPSYYHRGLPVTRLDEFILNAQNERVRGGLNVGAELPKVAWAKNRNQIRLNNVVAKMEREKGMIFGDEGVADMPAFFDFDGRAAVQREIAPVALGKAAQERMAVAHFKQAGMLDKRKVPADKFAADLASLPPASALPPPPLPPAVWQMKAGKSAAGGPGRAEKKKNAFFNAEPQAWGGDEFAQFGDEGIAMDFKAPARQSQGFHLMPNSNVNGRLIQRRAVARGQRGWGRGLVPPPPPMVIREYAHKVRANRQPHDREDFAETLYWKADIKTDAKTGEGKIEFGLNDSVTTFKVFADGFTTSGALGGAKSDLKSIIPFYAEAKLPLEVTAGDKILLPISLINGTEAVLAAGSLAIDLPAPFKLGPLTKSIQQLIAGQRARVIQPINVGFGNGAKNFVLKTKAGQYSDKVTRELMIKPKGFPVEKTFGGILEPNKSVKFKITVEKNVVPESMTSAAAIYPSPLANLSGALERLIQDPYGCFEQTSSTSYPLTMAQQYFQTHQGVDPKLITRSNEKLENGYKKLVSFWCPDRGYEWFGADPGHEALTAFGLLHFTDMSKVRQVDQAMIATTRSWLMKQKDGHGGFNRKRRGLHTWIEDKDCSNAYITWALLESGQSAADLKQELDSLKTVSNASTDGYVIALAANSFEMAGDKAQAKKLMQRLASLQKSDGGINGTMHSIVGSGGEALQIEGASLATLAWLREPEFAGNVEKSIKFLADSCEGGRYGSTQSTVLALRAITTYDKQRAVPKAPGRVRLYADGQGIGDWIAFDKKSQESIKLPDPSELLTPGEHEIEIRMEGGSAMPYALAVKYNRDTPDSSKDCKLNLGVKLAQDKVAEGATTEANVTVTNTSAEAIPTPVAIVGIPGGLEPRHNQLKELVKKSTIDSYEVIGRDVVLYWRSMPSNAKVQIPLSLVAAVPGTYTGPASRAYLYYTDEHKKWVDGLRVEIAAKN